VTIAKPKILRLYLRYVNLSCGKKEKEGNAHSFVNYE
jgi:hypothetical protein